MVVSSKSETQENSHEQKNGAYKKNRIGRVYRSIYYKKMAFLFPGQGAQSVGMGHELFQEYDFVREIFDMAEETVRINLSKLCFKGPMEELTKTVNLQPALTAVNLSYLAALQKEAYNLKPDYCAGHSLGEYSALCASKIVSKVNAMKLVFKRGELMHRESLKQKGAMKAIVGLDIETVEKLTIEVQQDNGIVSVANHNTEKQIVITGEPDPVNKVASLAIARGGKAISLKVSGAWHSELIRGAEPDFIDFIETIPFNKPDSDVVFNVTADCEESPEKIKQIMTSQLISPVKWYDAMGFLQNRMTEIFVEIGPKKVLTGILKRSLRKDYECRLYNVNDMKGLEKFISEVM